jgi:hypothetical protein
MGPWCVARSAAKRLGRRKRRRWRAYLTVVEEDEPEGVAIYCPGCAKREFEADDG